jgi:hypothetical protein
MYGYGAVYNDTNKSSGIRIHLWEVNFKKNGFMDSKILKKKDNPGVNESYNGFYQFEDSVCLGTWEFKDKRNKSTLILTFFDKQFEFEITRIDNYGLDLEIYNEGKNTNEEIQFFKKR